jgi:hypothetical protein
MYGELPCYVHALIGEYLLPDGHGLSAPLRLAQRLSQLPEPVSWQVGEDLEVRPGGVFTGGGEQRLTIVGESSGADYGEFLLAAPWQQVHVLALTLRLALNHPLDLADEDLLAYSRATGWDGCRCGHCREWFPDPRDTLLHERHAHSLLG